MERYMPCPSPNKTTQSSFRNNMNQDLNQTRTQWNIPKLPIGNPDDPRSTRVSTEDCRAISKAYPHNSLLILKHDRPSSQTIPYQ